MLRKTLPLMSLPQVADELHALFANTLPDGRPVSVMLYGDPGVAKTTYIHDVISTRLAASTGRNVRVIHENLNRMEPQDIAGIPFPDLKGYKAQQEANPDKPARRPAAIWTRPDLIDKIDRIMDDDPETVILLLLDEFGQCGAQTQKAAVPMLAEGLIGDAKMPPNVWVWATSNFQDNGAGVSKMLSHAGSRMLKLPVYMPAQNWIKSYAHATGMSPAAVQFVERNAAVFEGADDEYIERQRRSPEAPQCNYRSFTYAMNALDALKQSRGIDDPREVPTDEFVKALLRGYIGPEMADKFIEMAPTMHLLPDPKDIYRDWQTAPLPEGADFYAQFPLQAMLIQLITATSADPDKQEALLQYTTRLRPELASGVLAIVHDPKRGRTVLTTETSRKFIGRHASLFTAISEAA